MNSANQSMPRQAPQKHFPKPQPSADDGIRLVQSTVLKLSSFVRRGFARNDRFAVKHSKLGTYLNVSRDQLGLLEKFREGSTVPKVLSEIIHSRQCPPLREFYELVSKAAEKKVLVEEPEDTSSKKRPVDYRFSLPSWQAVASVAAAIGAGLYAAFTSEMQLPSHVYEYAAGYLLISVAVSLGFLLAGGVLRARRAEVYDPKWKWVSPVPHFRFNLMDARTLPGKEEALVGLVRLAPLLLFQAVAAVVAPAVSFVLILGLAWQCLPLRSYPISQFLNGITNRIPSDSNRRQVFEYNRWDRQALARRFLFENKKYLALTWAYWTAWLVFVILLVFQVLSGLFPQVVPDASPSAVLALVLAGFAAGVTVKGLRMATKSVWHRSRKALQKRAERKRRKDELAPYSFSNPPPREKILATLSESLVFGEVKPKDREAILEKLEPHFFPAKRIIINENEDPDRLYLVFKGSLEVSRELSTGRLLRLARIGPGDVFGKIPLWDEPPRRRTIRSLEPVIVYSLSMTGFSSVVLSKESHQAIKNSVKASFLTRIPFFREWPRTLLQKLAAMGSFVSVPQGQHVIRKNQHVQFLYVIYDGVAEVHTDGQRRASLEIGDFFGEISVMRQTLSTVDIYAREDVRCLVFARNDFINFICLNPELALAFTDLCSKRFGRPVFPLDTMP